LTETEKRAYLLANNQLALNAGWDMEMLRVELEGLRRSDFDLEVIGFDINELAEVFRDFDFLVAGLTDEDSAPEPPEKPISQPGDLWLLGHHRLLCADATQPGDVGRLMGGEKADLVFSDCPYNVDPDGAASWSTAPIKSDFATVTFDPQHQGTVYASTGPGVAQSIDGGQNWVQLPLGPNIGLAGPISTCRIRTPSTPAGRRARTQERVG
jgi:hypothetical protein